MKSVNTNKPRVMIGTFDGFELTHGKFGQQYTTIDGIKYITFFDLRAPELKGLRTGSKVEFTVTAGPTVLCHNPHVEEPLPSAELVRVVEPA